MTNPVNPNAPVATLTTEDVAPAPQATARKNYRKAFSWGVIWLVGFTLTFTLIYSNFSAEGFGRFLAMTMIAAGATGSISNRGGVTRSFVKVGGIYFLVLLAVWLISSFGGRTA